MRQEISTLERQLEEKRVSKCNCTSAPGQHKDEWSYHSDTCPVHMSGRIATLVRQLAEREKTEQDLWEKLNCQDAEIDELKRQLAEAREECNRHYTRRVGLMKDLERLSDSIAGSPLVTRELRRVANLASPGDSTTGEPQ
jgi:uncharacterized coiled-coil protein SlyX